MANDTYEKKMTSEVKKVHCFAVIVSILLVWMVTILGFVSFATHELINHKLYELNNVGSYNFVNEIKILKNLFEDDIYSKRAKYEDLKTSNGYDMNDNIYNEFFKFYLDLREKDSSLKIECKETMDISSFIFKKECEIVGGTRQEKQSSPLRKKVKDALIDIDDLYQQEIENYFAEIRQTLNELSVV